MVLDKALLLKGLAGVAAIGGVGGGVVIAHKNGAFKSKKVVVDDAKETQVNLGDEDKKKAKKESVNAKLKTLGIEGCELEDSNITLPSTFSKECELTKEQFQKISFSNKGSTDVIVTGWTEGTNKIKLAIENKPGDENGIKFTFKEIKEKLTISGETSKGTITLRPGEKEFEEKEDKLSKVVNEAISAQLKVANDKLKVLSVPDDCRFDETESDTSLECDISKEQLKTIKFSNKGDGELTVEGLEDSQKVKLTVERNTSSEIETLNYKIKNDNNTNITVKGTTGEPTKFSIRSNKETEFEEKDNTNVLSKKVDTAVSANLKVANEKLGTLKIPESCRFDETEKDDFIECDISEPDFKKIKFSNKTDDTDLTVTGLNSNETIKLKVERTNGGEGGHETLKYFIKDLKKDLTITGTGGDSQKITLKKGSDKEFEEKDNSGKLSKKVDPAVSAKIKGFNNNLVTLGIPDGCRLDDTESDEKLECNIDETQIKKIKFWNKGEGDLTISSGTGFSSLKLALSKKGDELKYVFKDANRNIVLANNGKSLTLKQYAENEFEFKEEVLQRSRNIEEVAKLVNLTCTYEANSKGNNGTCTLSKDFINVSVDGTTSSSLQFYDSNESLKDKKGQVKFDFSEYEYVETYERNVKFTFKGDTLEDKKNGGKLEKDKTYEVKTLSGVICLSKKVQESQ